jgi:hypothetical protein
VGGDCTASAVENRFRKIKIDGKAINLALKNGVDPINLKIGDPASQVHGWYNAFSRLGLLSSKSLSLYQTFSLQSNPPIRICFGLVI